MEPPYTEQVNYDCLYFKGPIPCTPNKLRGRHCGDCPEYAAISKRILIIKLGAMGDVIRTTPLVEQFQKEFPNCHITWITETPGVLPGGAIQEIWKWDAVSLFKARSLEFDLAINLDKETEACLLLAQVKAKTKYGFTWENGHIAPATPAAKHKLHTGFFDDLSQKNTKSYLTEIFEICHREYQGQEYLLNVQGKWVEHWKDLPIQALKKVGDHAHLKPGNSEPPVIGLNTGCGPRWKTREWPEEYWRELTGLILARGMVPVLLGGELEDARNKRLEKQTGAFYPGTHSLESFFGLVSHCHLIVTQVSMAMHIAVALRKKLVLMNNIFNKHEFDLFNRGVLLEPDLGCDCFYGVSCSRQTPCMNSLQPESVIKAISRLLA